MKYIYSFPYEVEKVEHIWIPLSSGIKLAATLWLPKVPKSEKVATILEYIPYRRRDGTVLRDSVMHPYFAGHGYACLRVDIRGSGDSEGFLADEYLEEELVDGEEILRWIEDQQWSNGRVGMYGKSWGGFNGLQMAARRPKQLKAVIAVCASDDRYRDDIHYMGGCLLNDNLSWASTMLSFNSTPPDPEVVGEKWRDLWFARLNKSEHWLKAWLTHQHRDEFWRHASVCEDYQSIECPVMAVSGWADGYSNAVFRLMKNLKSPFKGLVGPWGHEYPHRGTPGPAINFLRECVKWWDQWLGQKDTDIMKGPTLMAWMQESVPPTMCYKIRPGRWVGENNWPSPNIHEQPYYLSSHGLLDQPEKNAKKPFEKEISIRSPLSVGLFAGKWCSFTATPDLPHDQREEDGGAIFFTSEPLKEDVEMLGSARLEFEFSCDKPAAMLAVRLSDVAFDDQATRVTYGLLNLNHINGHSKPEPLVPGDKYKASIELNEVAMRFPKGHRIRLSLSTSYWPLAWPSPEPARINFYLENCVFYLPQRKLTASDEKVPSLGKPEGAVPLESEVLKNKDYHWHVIRDLGEDRSTLDVLKDEGRIYLPHIDMEIERRTRETYSYEKNDYYSLEATTENLRSMRRDDWEVTTVAKSLLTSESEYFRLTASLDAYEGVRRVFSRNWDEIIPRNLV